MENIDVKDVVVKISTCNKCGGVVRTAIKHLMDKKSIKDFAKEVFEFNLNVKEQSLLDYRSENPKWCECH